MEAHRSPDPVDDPQAYQQHLLDLLGDDDPAVVQAHMPGEWHTMVDLAGPNLQAAPADGEWSVFGCLAHVFDAEIVMSGRYRWIVADDEPPLLGYDQDLWVQRLHPESESATDLLASFAALRQTNVAMWLRSTAPERERVGLHAERGPESYELSFRMIAGHDRFHLRQARETLDAVTRA